MKTLKNIINDVLNKKKKNLFTFLTGAGLSSDSGIPTYRGVDGIWVKGTKFHKPEEFGTYRYFVQHPEEKWQYSLFWKKQIEAAQPNIGHHAIVEIENLLQNRFRLITQNIDNLHFRAGNTRERGCEIHGHFREVRCAKDCTKEAFPFPAAVKGKSLKEDLTSEDIHNLKCPNCGNWLRPNVLWFDEYYDERNFKLHSALRAAKNTGLLFIVGTSGATQLPMRIAETTLQYGGYVVDLNIEDNLFTELLADKVRAVTWRGKTSVLLPKLKKLIEESMS